MTQSEISVRDVISMFKKDALCFSGSDKEAILDLVTSRSNAQRQETIAAYKSNFGQVQKYISSSRYSSKLEVCILCSCQVVVSFTFRHKSNVVSPGPDWGSEVWADRQVWAAHRQSDENPSLPRCQRDPRCSKSTTFTSLSVSCSYSRGYLRYFKSMLCY